MICPVCREPMLVFELDEVEIDSCVSCGGIWLDAGELDLLLEGTPESDRLLSSFTDARGVSEKKRKCPICLKKMEKVYCGLPAKVLIDRCKRGDGLWFDADELNEVLRMSDADNDSRVLKLLEELFGNKKER